jgi:hypothetical protein
MSENNNYSRPSLSPIYQIYSDLGEMDPYSVETEEQEDLYYKSLLWDCKNCDLVSENKMYVITHLCPRNNKSNYEQHQMEAMNRKLERLKKES